jgi:hypothetical protein
LPLQSCKKYLLRGLNLLPRRNRGIYTRTETKRFKLGSSCHKDITIETILEESRSLNHPVGIAREVFQEEIS